MLLTSRLPLSSLIGLCQALRHGLGAGLPIVDVFRQQSKRGSQQLRPVAARISSRLADGDALEDVLNDERGVFPPLFIGMASMGEQTGNMPEIFRELENYYRMQQTLKRRFLAEITWPVIQFVMAIFVITLMILILGWIADNPAMAFDPLGFGVGPAGAIRFLVGVFVGLTLLVGAYLFVTRVLGRKAAVHGFLLRLPALGPCLHALALMRFSLGLRLTMEAGMRPWAAVRRSLIATGNGAYEAGTDAAVTALKDGEELTTALERCRVFPEEFLSVVASADEGGRVPEAMEQQSEYYQEEASRKMSILARFASFGVWAMIALLLIIVIARMVMSVAGVYGQAFKDAGV